MTDAQHRVIIDTDPGLGHRIADVDDGLALFFSLNSPEFQIEGISTVYGNTKVEIGYKLARNYLEMANKTEIPVFKGSSSNNDLGKSNPAVEFLIQKVKEHPGEITLMPLGPLTNIATAARLYSSFLDDLKEIIMMGGTLSPISFFSKQFKGIDRRFFDKIKIKPIVCEFNFGNDATATKEIIEAKTKTPRFECGLDVCCQLVIKKEHLKIIESNNTPSSKFMATQSEYWLKMWKLNGYGGFFPFDTVCPIFKLRPDLFNTTKLSLIVDTDKLPGKLSIVPTTAANRDYRINVVSSFKKEEYKEEFLDFLCSRLK